MGLFSFGKSNEEKASHLHHKGVNLSKKEKFEEALECFNEAISIEPEVWDFWFSKGSALSELCLLYTSPSPRDLSTSRMPSSA